MGASVIRNVALVNEGKTIVTDVFIKNARIEQIAGHLDVGNLNIREVDGGGKYLFPGVIDAQVHFREPGFTHKADIASESAAALAGGVTTFFDMPNTYPATLTQELLEAKYVLAAQKSFANYSFFMGISQDNIEEVLKTDSCSVCGVSDDGLYFNHEKGIIANYPEYLELLFSKCETLIALHSEDDETINQNYAKYLKIHGENIPVEFHPKIRSTEACFKSTKRIVEIAKKHKSRLHVLHVSSAKELSLFENDCRVRNKRITGEACVHHLVFDNNDYETLGNKIKWNPAIKTKEDKHGLLEGLKSNLLDIISTDHAPHLWPEKEGPYSLAKSGGPLVQFSMVSMIELCLEHKIPLEFIAEKMSHNVAEIYRIIDRGYIREGYFADLVLVDFNENTIVDESSILSKCKWSPFESRVFKSKISHTWVNGNLVYNQGFLNNQGRGMRVAFDKIR